MAMDLKEIEKYIKEAMPDAKIEIQDLHLITMFPTHFISGLVYPI